MRRIIEGKRPETLPSKDTDPALLDVQAHFPLRRRSHPRPVKALRISASKLGYGPDKRLKVTVSTRDTAGYRDPAGLTMVRNSVFNGWRFEDVWLDR